MTHIYIKDIMERFEDLGELKIFDSPSEFRLSDAYPNPFNAAATIEYSIDRQGKINLAVYNILQHKVVDLVDEMKPAGNYSITWNAADVSSGMYLLRLTMDENHITKKVLLLK